ncbi:MAG: outer membrane protein assembly factor BamA, partial [Verrucomicrobiae bacterium]|nr:outer membrane protein assembly factor BamA [Verrucomicrobiae bacterium]
MSPAIRLTLLLTLAFPLLGISLLQAQLPQGKVTVGKVDIEFIGVQNVNEEVLRSNMQVRSGMEYSEAIVDDSLRALYRTGLFEYIDVKRTEVSGGKLDLIFRVKAKYRVLAIYFDGNYRIKEKRLKKEISLKANAALNERQVNEDAQTLFEFYQKRGFTQVKIDYSIDRDADTGFGEVTFTINEGPKVKVSDVNFIGNENIKDKKLVKQMKTRPWNWLSWLTGSGKLDENQFEEDLIKARDYAREEGYLDVEIFEDQIEYDYSRKGRLAINIPIHEGRQYEVGKMTISGNELFPSELLMSGMELKEGDVFSPKDIDEANEALTDLYGSVGYLDCRVNIKRVPNLETGRIDLEFEVTEGERFRVESVVIEGNTKTKSVVILRELSLAPGMPFDLVRMKISQQRLENTQWFEKVEVTDEQTNIPQRRNLKVTVEEGRTGNFTFGAGFSSIQRAVGFIEITQGNFDLFNFRSFFQGDGQKMRIRIEAGSRSSEYSLYFEEPYFLDNYFYQLGFGFQVYNRESDYLSTLYSETRRGFQVFLRKNLIEAIEGRVAYSLEDVTLDFFGSVPFAFRQYFNEDELNERGNAIESRISRMTFSLYRDDRDKLLFTNRGTRLQLINTIAGGPLGGTQDFGKVEFLGGAWIPTFELGQGILVDLRGGVSFGYDDTKRTPFAEQFFLGGPNTIRGYDYRLVGPVDMGEPLRDPYGNIFRDQYGNPR